ncbi:DUF2809 domain-containing protein [Cellulomonas sp. JH27-2]|uniref:DUF2809 domain-containing protein n=1 Tax=Cellulomonas sp. JH27-2 TaxID=2774139 RepID=UPI0017865D61|nr:DUF2809 domain-containing protein [Cellulomonas sp. JH27-2]
MQRSRPVLSLVAVVVVAMGLSVAHWGAAPWADPLGDALYAVLVYVLVLLVAPRLNPAYAGTLTAGICAAVEFFQLTGLADDAVDRFSPLRYVLGTTFSTLDLFVYVGAAALAALVDHTVTRERTPAPDLRR